SKESGLSEEAVTSIIDDWGLSSIGDEALLIQHSVARQLGGVESDWQKAILAARTTASSYTDIQRDAFVKANYNRTQQWLRSQGIAADDVVTLWRGTKLPIDNATQVKGNALSSWTTSRDIASAFGRVI